MDPEQAVRRPAFDHERLAKALKDRGIEAAPDALSFAWIDLSSDGNVVRFRIKEDKWQFNENEGLTQYDGEINEESLEPMKKEKPSEGNHTSTAIIFVNQRNAPISVDWIDYSGGVENYVTIQPGHSSRRPTYVANVWRVSDSETKAPIASYLAKEGESLAVVEEGSTSLTKLLETPNGEDEDGDKSITKEEPSTLPQEGPTKADPNAKQEDLNSAETNPTSQVVHSQDANLKDLEIAEQPLKAFIKEYNVWVRESGGHETQISTSGTKKIPFDNEKGALSQSPDHRFAIASQYTPEQEHKVYTVESSPTDQLQPHLKEFQYLKPGDKTRVDRPRMFDLVEKKEITTDGAMFENHYVIYAMDWNADGDEYRLLHNQRGHQALRVLGMNTKGQVRTIIEETSKTFVDYSSKEYYHNIKDADEMIWASERDGWNHLYLYDLKSGSVKNQITVGQWVVRSVDRVEEKKRQIWFTAFGFVEGQDPYYAQLLRVNLDGANLTVLTEGDGNHSWHWSPDHKYLIDTWSRVDLAPKTILRDAETGKQLLVLEEDNLDRLYAVDWTKPERFAAPGRDGTTLIYGIIITPSHFDPSAKYPVIEKIYAGPHDFDVPKPLSLLLDVHALAELGFIVVQIDGMGTNWRSKSFHGVCWKNLKDAGFPDRIAWLKAAAELRPWMDLKHVGIYGGSAGGQNAMGALLWHGDFYKAAAADCGCHDNRMDKIWWNEQWMGYPVDQSYADSSNVVNAHRLKGALMLIVGELDHNVDPASTMQVVHALNKAEKDYELLFMPGEGHGVASTNKYALRRQRDFFVRHLLGVEPPRRNG